jgi:glycosyltransferase involved in cell wall biosynthesis
MSTAKALLFSSVRESFGGVVLEAAERATPAVVALHSGVAGLADSLPPGAAWAGYADSMDSMIDVLARGIERAVRSEEAEWYQKSQGAYGFATANSWVLRGTRLAHIYRALLAGENPDAM